MDLRVSALHRGLPAPLDSAARVEQIEIITSPAVWIISTPHVPMSGPAARPLTSSSVKEGTMAFEIEVERPVGAPPEVRVFSGRVEGALDQIAGRPGFAR